MIIVDAYNFIGQCRFTSLDAADKEEALIAKLIQFHLTSSKKITVVFDGQPAAWDKFALIEKRNGITIITTEPGKSADNQIKFMIKNNPSPKTLTIVSADNEIRTAAKHRKCQLLKPAEFEREIHNTLSPQVVIEEKPSSEQNIEEWLKEFGG